MVYVMVFKRIFFTISFIATVAASFSDVQATNPLCEEASKMAPPPTTQLQNLPLECLNHIFKFCPLRKMGPITRVDQIWNQTARFGAFKDFQIFMTTYQECRDSMGGDGSLKNGCQVMNKLR